MNYYEARQVDPDTDRPDAGKWRFTCRNDDRIWPVGWCADGCAGHDDSEEADQHFYDSQAAKGVQWQTVSQASRCVICDAWTPDILTAVSNLLTYEEYVCKRHFAGDNLAASWLFERHPFAPGIVIVASW